MNAYFTNWWTNNSLFSYTGNQPLIKPFFFVLSITSFIWILVFKLVFTKRILKVLVREIGVGAKRVVRTTKEIKRKTFHLFGLILPSFIYFGLQYTTYITLYRIRLILVAVTSIIWSCEILRLSLPGARSFFDNVFTMFLRQNEKLGEVTGTSTFVLGATLTTLFFPPAISLAGILFLILGDMVAALVGVSFGSIRITQKKSLEGTLACFFACILVGFIMFHNIWLWEYMVVCGSVTAALVELYSPVDDNLTIPLFSSLALYISSYRIGVHPEDFPL